MITLFLIVQVRRNFSISGLYFLFQVFTQDKLNCIHIIPFCRLSCRTFQGWESVHVLYIYWNRSSWKIDTSSSGADQIVSLSVAIFSKLIPALLSQLQSTYYRYSCPFAIFVNNDAMICLPFSGVLSAMSAMVNLEIPWINIMSKMDLVTENTDDPAGGARNGIRGRKNIAR